LGTNIYLNFRLDYLTPDKYICRCQIQIGSQGSQLHRRARPATIAFEATGYKDRGDWDAPWHFPY
jgi:hypothetical protein